MLKFLGTDWALTILRSLSSALNVLSVTSSVDAVRSERVSKLNLINE